MASGNGAVRYLYVVKIIRPAYSRYLVSINETNTRLFTFQDARANRISGPEEVSMDKKGKTKMGGPSGSAYLVFNTMSIEENSCPVLH